MSIPFATHFLAGSLLTLLVPVGLLIAIATWYVVAVRRIPGPDSTQALPSELGESPSELGDSPLIDPRAGEPPQGAS